MIDFNAIPDEDLYGMCIQGDEGAWQYTYKYIYQCILGTCKKRDWRLREDPEEMAQQITVHLIEKAMKKVKEKSKFRGFIRVMTVNKILDSFKIRFQESLDNPVRNRKGEEFIPEYHDTAILQDKSLMNLQIVSVVDAAVKKLSKDCQKIVNEYLKFKMGLYDDYKELSRVLNMPIPTVSSSVRRCLNKLVELKEIKALKNI